MRTPSEFNNLIIQKTITAKMLSECLFSVNKRAKNYRDNERKYRNLRKNCRYWSDIYDNEEKNREMKEKYYKKKDILLSIIAPTCIHREQRLCKVRHYEYELDFEKILLTNKLLPSGRFFDEDSQEYIEFVDVYEKTENKYYLYYDIGTNHCFHHPIDSEEGYNLPIIDIGNLDTWGTEIDDLISVQFVDKVIKLIESGEYTYLDSVTENIA